MMSICSDIQSYSCRRSALCGIETRGIANIMHSPTVMDKGKGEMSVHTVQRQSRTELTLHMHSLSVMDKEETSVCAVQSQLTTNEREKMSTRKNIITLTITPCDGQKGETSVCAHAKQSWCSVSQPAPANKREQMITRK